MKTVWKVPVNALFPAVECVKLPIGAKFLCANNDPTTGLPAVWVLVETNNRQHDYILCFSWTGKETPKDADYIGTVQVDFLVNHVWVVND